MLPLHLANRSPLRVLLCGLMRRVIHEPAAASRAVSGALSMALVRKYSGFNLYSAVPVPTQSSAVLVGRVGVEPTTPEGIGFTVRRVCRFATYPWWKGVFILKHLKLDGAPLPVAARALKSLHYGGTEGT